VDRFRTREEASAFIDEHLSPKKKLRTMNEISAADAAQLFRAARDFDSHDPLSEYCPRPDYFPKDIAARDFLQCLELYSKMESEGSEYPFASKTPSTTSYTVEHRQISDAERKAYSAIPEKVLEGSLTRMQRQVCDLLVRRNLSYKQIATELAISESTVHKHISDIYEEYKVKNFRELIAKLSSRPA